MGNCCSSKDSSTTKFFAIKLPHSTEYLYYDEDKGQFTHHANINTFLQNLYYVSNYINYVVYNDDTSKICDKHTKHGHSKGIVTWSKDKIGWLCHSVPNFPRKFDGRSISSIEPTEIIFGQSFQYIEIPYDTMILLSILNQLHIMDAHIYMEKNNMPANKLPCTLQFNVLKLTENIIHIAKPPTLKLDIYSKFIATKSKWKVQSWQRGHEITDKCDNVRDIKTIFYSSDNTNIEYDSYQDNSKWAVSDNHYWVGDLNRMTSQFNKGGGGFICRDSRLASCLNSIVRK